MKTVYVGMSGGVDSSVAAALLKQQGYKVVGVYMKNWTQAVGGVECPWQRDLADARAAAAVIDIPFKVIDFQTEYRQKVVDIMVREYAAGRTPNPDVLCNQEIKFKLFMEMALADGADLVATGHYAQTEDGRLLAGADTDKDQSYFLYRIEGQALQRTIFPVGNLTKPEVRKLAEQFGLPTAKKPDSQGICFVGEVGIKEFLQQYIQTVPGPVVLKRTREEIGQHDGAAFYTIGQRHGLGIGGGRPYFVVGKDMDTDTVFVTDDSADLELSSDRFEISDAHWIHEEPEEGKTFQVRSRYRAEAIPARLEKAACGWIVRLTKPERAVAVGQSAVVYDGLEVLGGGFIQKVAVAAAV
jgi:tRNA-specific 2-thiouridylase